MQINILKIIKYITIHIVVLFAIICLLGTINYSRTFVHYKYQKYNLYQNLYSDYTFIGFKIIPLYFDYAHAYASILYSEESKEYQDWLNSMIYHIDVERLSAPYVFKHALHEINFMTNQEKQASLLVPIAIIGNLIKSEYYSYCYNLDSYNEEGISEKERTNRAKLFLECAYVRLLLDIIDKDKNYHNHIPYISYIGTKMPQFQHPYELKIFKDKNPEDMRLQPKEIVCKKDKKYCTFEDIRWQIGLCEKEIYFQKNNECITKDIMPLLYNHKFCENLSYEECKGIERYLKHHVFNLLTE